MRSPITPDQKRGSDAIIDNRANKRLQPEHLGAAGDNIRQETRVKADGVFNDNLVGRVGALETAADNNREAIDTNTAAIESLRQRFEAHVAANQRLFEEQVAANQRLEATVARQATEIAGLQKKLGSIREQLNGLAVEQNTKYQAAHDAQAIALQQQLDAWQEQAGRQHTELADSLRQELDDIRAKPTVTAEQLKGVEEAVGALSSNMERCVTDGMSAINEIRNRIRFLWEDNGLLRMEARQQQNSSTQEQAALRAMFSRNAQRFDEIELEVGDIRQRINQAEEKSENIETRIGDLEQRVGGVEKRSEDIEENIDDIAKRVGQVEDWQTENDSASE